MKKILAILFIAFSSMCHSQEVISFTAKDGREFKDYIITKIDTSGISLQKGSSLAKLPMNLLPDDLRKNYEEKALELSLNEDDQLLILLRKSKKMLEAPEFSPNNTDVESLQESVRAHQALVRGLVLAVTKQGETQKKFNTYLQTILEKTKENDAALGEIKKSLNDRGIENPQWKPITKFSGTTGRQTENIKIVGPQYRVEWNYGGSEHFSIVVYKNGKYEKLLVNTSGATKEDTILRGAGTIYLDITADGPYSVWVDDQK